MIDIPSEYYGLAFSICCAVFAKDALDHDRPVFFSFNMAASLILGVTSLLDIIG
jgi:hypothetical protein